MLPVTNPKRIEIRPTKETKIDISGKDRLNSIDSGCRVRDILITCAAAFSPITKTKAKFTYNQLKEKVSKFAWALKNQGINKGDRVIIYMPMIPEAVIAMLGCARIGAIHSVVFGGFASNELASRIDDSKAKLLVTASCGFEPGRTVEYLSLIHI